MRFELHQIKTESDVIGAERDPHAGCLQRRAAAETDGRIVTEDRQVGDIAAGVKSFRHGLHQAETAAPSQVIHTRGAGMFERGFAF